MARRITVLRKRKLLHFGIDLDAAPWMERVFKAMPAHYQNSAPGASDQLASVLQLYRPTNFPRLSGLPLPGRLYRMARAMRGYDLVVTHGDGALDAALAHTLFRQSLRLAPLVHYHHGIADAAVGRVRRWRRRIALERADRVVAPLAAVAEEIGRLWFADLPPSVRGARIEAIPPGIEAPPRVAPAPDAIPRVVKRRGEKWIGARASDLSGRRNQVITALKTLDAGWQLVVFGDRDASAALRAIAVEQGVGDRLHVSDRWADPGPVAGLFEIILLDFASGPMPVLLLRAQAAGVPVVAAAPAALREALGEESASLRVEPGDGGGLVAALATLVVDDRRRERAATEARARARECNAPAMAQRHLALYEMLFEPGANA